MTALLGELLDPGRFAFERPLALPVALVLALALLALARRRRTPRALAWPALAEARAAGAFRGDPMRLVAGGLRGAALLGLALALAGPTRRGELPPETRPGLDLVLVIDASASMRALDAEVAGAWRQRIELAREVVARFAQARASAGDRVALVAFGDTAFTLCPLATDGALLAAALTRVEAGMAGNSTALGDALALAVKRAGAGSDQDAGALVEGPTAAPRAGRLVVLLTDGRSNAGAVPVEVAAALARASGTRVHAVGIGSRGEVAMASPSGAGASSASRATTSTPTRCARSRRRRAAATSRRGARRTSRPCTPRSTPSSAPPRELPSRRVRRAAARALPRRRVPGPRPRARPRARRRTKGALMDAGLANGALAVPVGGLVAAALALVAAGRVAARRRRARLLGPSAPRDPRQRDLCLARRARRRRARPRRPPLRRAHGARARDGRRRRAPRRRLGEHARPRRPAEQARARARPRARRARRPRRRATARPSPPSPEKASC